MKSEDAAISDEDNCLNILDEVLEVVNYAEEMLGNMPIEVTLEIEDRTKE